MGPLGFKTIRMRIARVIVMQVYQLRQIEVV